MLKFSSRLLGMIVGYALFASVAHSTPVAAGYISWDVNIPRSVGTFDITNFTGVNSLPPDFPITTTLGFSGLSLTVHFSDGSQTVFGASYFTLSLDGLSFNGNDIAIGGTNPLPIDALLTGTFSTTSIALAGGGTDTILSGFSAEVLPSVGTSLSDGDLAVIFTTSSTDSNSVPEPSSLLLATAAIFGVRRVRSKRIPKP